MYYIYILNKEHLIPKKSHKFYMMGVQQYQTSSDNQFDAENKVSAEDKKKHRSKTLKIAIGYHIINLISTLSLISKECFEKYEFEDLTSEEKQKYLLRDGFFFGLGFLLVIMTMLFTNLNWIWSAANLLLFILAHFYFIRNFEILQK